MVKYAADLALAGQAAGLVTGPIAKKRWHDQGIPFAGHTPFLTWHAGVETSAMCFWSADLRVVLFTVHLPLREVPNRIWREAIVAFIRMVDRELFRWFGERFHFLFSGLNPHAGEEGLMGREEAEEIVPALAELAGDCRVSGPYPPDTVFLKQRETEQAVVVCWYHDQGLIPFKIAHFRDGVNMTLGLPYIRTAPDHGTGFDIAGRDQADPSSLLAALSLAEQLVMSGSPEIA